MSKKSNKKLHIICLAAFAVLLCAAIWLLGRITEPKYMSGVLEGAMTQEYYNEENRFYWCRKYGNCNYRQSYGTE